MKSSNLLLLVIGLSVIIVVASTVVYVAQDSKPSTTFELLPIAMPQWDTGQDKPSTYINVSVKNNGATNMTNVTMKLSGGYANSSNVIPQQTFWIFTRTFSVIELGETVTVPTYAHAYASYYKAEISTLEGINETLNQWVSWRVTDVPLPP